MIESVNCKPPKGDRNVLFFTFAGTLSTVIPFTGIDTILLGGPERGRGSVAETVLGRGDGIPNMEFL